MHSLFLHTDLLGNIEVSHVFRRRVSTRLRRGWLFMDLSNGSSLRNTVINMLHLTSRAFSVYRDAKVLGPRSVPRFSGRVTHPFVPQTFPKKTVFPTYPPPTCFIYYYFFCQEWVSNMSLEYLYQILSIKD